MRTLQDFIGDNLNIDANTSATILITLFVFAFGILISLSGNGVKNLSRRTRRRKIILLSIEYLGQQVGKQSESYYDLASQIDFASEGHLLFKKSEIGQVHSIREIGYEQCYEAFFYGIENKLTCNGKLRRKSFVKLWDLINSLGFWHDRSFLDFQEYLELYQEHNEKRNHAIEQYRKIINEELSRLNNRELPAESEDYLTQLDAINFRWQQMEGRTLPNVINDNLIEPLIELNRRFHHIPLAVHTTDYLLEASYQYRNLKNVIEIKQTQFQLHGNNFKKSAKLLSKISLILISKRRNIMGQAIKNLTSYFNG